MRGAGFTAWDALSSATLPDGKTANPYAKYYKTGSKADAIHQTCKTGYAYNYSGGKHQGFHRKPRSPTPARPATS